MVTIPCPRRGQIGCCGTITARDPGVLAKRKYCSLPCSAYARVARGIVAPRQPHEHYVIAGSVGGRKGGAVRRKRAMLRAAADLQRLIPTEMELRLTAVDYRRVLALLARAWLRGHAAGRSAARMSPAQKRAAA